MGGVFLHYIASLEYWVIGSEIGGGVGWIVFVVTPPTTGGYYHYGGWKYDPQLTVSGETINMSGECH